MKTSAPLPTPAPRPPGLPNWRELLRARAVLAVLLIELVLAATVAYGLWALRRQTLDAELRMLGSLSSAMAEQADGTLAVAETVLRATRGELRDGLLEPGTPAAHELLRARAQALPKFRALVVLDAQGRRLATSRDDSASSPPLNNEDFFVAARDGNGPELYIGTPFVSRVDGRSSIGVSTAWRDAAGEFKGVVVLVADAGFLDGAFEHIAPSRDAAMAIYRRDGAPVSDGPARGIGRALSAEALRSLWSGGAAITSATRDTPDGVARLVAAHTLQRFPLMVVITRDVPAVLADWSDQAWLVAAFAASALLVTFVLTLRNSREQQRLEASQRALAAEQERAVRAFQAAQEGNWEWNPVTGQSFLSPRMKELLGLAPDDELPADGNPLVRTSVHADDVERLTAAFNDHLEGRSPHFEAVFRALAKGDGRWHQIRSRGQLWRDADGRARLFSGAASDVTAELDALAHAQQLETQLQRARKLEALGTLAGGIAHDFNNLLAAVIGFGELARASATEGGHQARQLDRVLQAGARGKALVERILSFSRTGQRTHTPFALQPVIDEVLQLLGASLPARVRLERDLQAPDAVVAGDATAVFEAVMNLCTNAIHAMPEGGTLGLELRCVEQAAPRVIFERTLAAGRYARLVVSDTGVGITPEVMARLFEPFFTTKAPHEGTGLGLAVVRGVMADVGGAIDVDSAPGRGARFSLYFPISSAELPIAPAASAASSADAPPGCGQTVLVVDDETALVALSEELLAELGYEPVGFCSAAKALAAVRAEPARFDLVLTDEVMPGLTGTALACELRALCPNLPIVMASGYGGPQLEGRARAAGVNVLVRKPLTRAELARALATALAAARARAADDAAR